MQKNKYDLAQEAASFLYDSETFETCERCFMNRECWKDMYEDTGGYPKKCLCASPDTLRKAIEIKYNL